MSNYPREDVCRKCGAHVGWIVSELGEMFALGLCDDCTLAVVSCDYCGKEVTEDGIVVDKFGNVTCGCGGFEREAEEDRDEM